MTDFRAIMEPVARELLGEPSRQHSTKTELRFGNNGSMKVDLSKGTFHDFERNIGGGVVDLVKLVKQCDHTAAKAWLKERFPGKTEDRPHNAAAKIVAEYDYADETGTLIYQVQRREPKDFRQRRPDGKGGWKWNLQGVTPLPYRLPEVLDAIAQDYVIFIVEGEKDADRLAKVGAVATCNSGGARKWRPELDAWFKDARVVILPDNDEPGQGHALAVAKRLYDIATSIKILHLPDLKAKGDVSDWLDAGGTIEQLNELADAQTDWHPTSTRFQGVWFGEESRLDPVHWIVQDTLPGASTAVLFGAAGCGKSFFALDMALHVATGNMWFGKQIRSCGVAYIAAEGGRGVGLRMQAWRQRHRDRGAENRFVLIPEPMDLRTPDGNICELIDDLKIWKWRMPVDLGLVVIDTLSRVLAGGDDADMRDMGAFLSNVERIQKETSATVLIVHHQGKDPGRGMRGHSSLIAAVDTAIEVSNENGIREAKVVKQKDGQDGQAFGFCLNRSTLGQIDEFGQDVTSCTVQPNVARRGD